MYTIPSIGEKVLVINDIEYTITDDYVSGHADIIGYNEFYDVFIYQVYILVNNPDILDTVLLAEDRLRVYIGNECKFEGIIFGVDII